MVARRLAAGRDTSLVRSGVGLAVSRGAQGATLLLATVLVARGTSIDDVGRFGVAITLGGFAAVIADAGLSQYLVPRLATTSRTDWPRHWAELRRFYLASAVPVAVVFAVLVGLVYDGETRQVLLATIPWWLALRVTLGIRAFLTVSERLDLDARAGLAEAVLAIACVGLAVELTGSPSVAALGLGVGAVLGLALRVRSLAAIGVRPGPRHARRLGLVRAARSFNGFNVLVVLYMRVDVLLLSLLASPGAVGLYQGPVRLLTAVLLIPDALAPILLSRAARVPDDRDLRWRQQRLLGTGVILGTGLTLVTAWLGDEMLSIIFGSSFREAGLAFTVLMAVLPVRLSSYLNGNQLVVRGRNGVRLACMAITATFAVVAGIPSIALFGYNGAAAVTLASEVMLLLTYATAVWLRLGRDAVQYPRLPGLR